MRGIRRDGDREVESARQCCQTVSAIDKACGAYLIFGQATETEIEKRDS